MEYVQFAFDQIARIPGVIYGAVIAALISYFGVRSANNSSLERLKIQHEQDEKQAAKKRTAELEDAARKTNFEQTQKEEDRKAAIRREVYTKAVEEVHAVIAYISSLPYRPLSAGSDDEGLQLFLKANAKVWLVSEQKAALLSRQLTNVVSGLFVNAITAARPSRDLMGRIRTLEDGIAKTEIKVDTLRCRISELNIQTDRPTFDTLHSAWTFERDYLQSLIDQLEQTRSKLKPDLDLYFQTIFRKMDDTQVAIVRLVSALRVELHLPEDEKLFLEQLEDMKMQAVAAVRQNTGLDLSA